MKKEALIMAAMAGLSLTSGKTEAKSDKSSKTYEKCWGINKCGKHHLCGVGKSDLKATKKAFGDEFAKTKFHDCANQGSCSRKSGQLNWVKVVPGNCLHIKGGFLIEKDEKGNKKVITE